MKRIVVIGAGIGGLTTAAVLAKAGFDVHVLEAHVYPGGCAGTFFHQGYRFDAGATLAGGFASGGPMDLVAKATGISNWPAKQSEPAMQVILPDGQVITRWGDEHRFNEYATAFGPAAEKFFRWQEQTANALWALTLRTPAWPPQTGRQAVHLIQDGLAWIGEDAIHRLNPSLFADAFRSLSKHLVGTPENFRLFIDAQLLISAQAVSDQANALYGAAALDLPRRGVVHLTGGIGAIAETLAQTLRDHGGKVSYHKEVTRIVMENRKAVAIEIKRGGRLPVDGIVANLPPWNIAQLLGDQPPAKLSRLLTQPETGWGAFMVYVGMDGSAVPANFPLHQQIIAGKPLGEGNSVFLSLSPEWDASRAPQGKRALTISTHTDFRPWWRLYQQDRDGYERRKQEYIHQVISVVEKALPGLNASMDILLSGTPLSFARFTRRAWGWVGGFPQTNLFQGWGPRLGPGLWMVGDSIFPGQSIAAVALGGLRVAEDIRNTVAQ